MERTNHSPPGKIGQMPGFGWLLLIIFAFLTCLEISDIAYQHGIEDNVFALVNTQTKTLLAEAREFTRRREAQIRTLADLMQTKNPKLYRAKAEHYAFLVYQECEKQGVDHLQLVAQMIQESNLDEYATGSSGEIGLMQIMPWWLTKADVLGLETITERELFDPVNNIRWGVAILARCLRNTNGNLHKALCFYNAGPKWQNGQKYADRVLRLRSKLEEQVEEMKKT